MFDDNAHTTKRTRLSEFTSTNHAPNFKRESVRTARRRNVEFSRSHGPRFFGLAGYFEAIDRETTARSRGRTRTTLDSGATRKPSAVGRLALGDGWTAWRDSRSRTLGFLHGSELALPVENAHSSRIAFLRSDLFDN